jgi:hypothetical protein
VGGAARQTSSVSTAVIRTALVVLMGGGSAGNAGAAEADRIASEQTQHTTAITRIGVKIDGISRPHVRCTDARGVRRTTTGRWSAGAIFEQ